MIVITSKTGWTEHYVLYDLPLSRGFAYYHAARVLEGERCRWPGRKGVIGKWIGEVMKWCRMPRRKAQE